jgi:hypothetical protein
MNLEPNAWTVLLGGALGSIIGVLASVGVAIYVVRRQAEIDRERILGDRRDEACLKLLELVHDMLGQIDAMFALNERALAVEDNSPSERQAELLSEILRLEKRAKYGQALAARVGGRVLDAYNFFAGLAVSTAFADGEQGFAAPNAFETVFNALDAAGDLLEQEVLPAILDYMGSSARPGDELDPRGLERGRKHVGD